MPLPTISYVTAGARFLASHYNNVKDYLDWLMNRPAVAAYRSVAGTVPSATWSNGIGLDLEDYDRDGMHNNVTQNSRIVVQTAGRYRVTARVAWQSNNTGIRGVQVRVNASGNAGAGVELAPPLYVPAVNGQPTVLVDSFSVALAVNDHVEMFGYQTSGINLGYSLAGQRNVSLELVFEGTI